jgi:CheY-like chemotaxis protein
MTAILVVDDDPGIRVVMRAVLEHEAYDIYEAEDGERALAFVEERLPDLIILDLMMPGIGGFEVLRRLKGDERTWLIPIVVLTAMGAPARKDAEEAGADGFFEKPFSPMALLQVVEETLGQEPRAPHPAAG